MNIKSIISRLSFAMALLFAVSMSAQDFKGLDKSPMDGAAFPSDYKDANKLIRITYGRPQLNDRKIEDLAPSGKVWRTGANEAAELTLYTPMTLGGTQIEPGTYTFYVIPGEKEWTAIINKDLNVWGSYFYKEDQDVARISVPVTEGKESLEAFSIAFEKAEGGVDMHLGWGTMRVAVPFKK
ncbi:DUF2911 domain-containing protein [Subsaximicrobium wynnwilliamsii]|uniref:DUF2911 domain-containing protein n=1 Tax=Subsaximicrobium wynnwilliamsii TaxID=291179 RepID=A0A5C6ZLF9_9FLAO|nr:DUF2911 domain-containing protein [Subsaximicrobium wynnwilliamsii]TXD84370.1 DUF2911 domain-containing protein [Subsaximicrobium wynnwilliamsii]TXD90051.1 DUF2911 domain-containing protein [Subsaximicrobium wynnwilliamsii]TXE04103.1 DUF2911 domain-containing protein [Subsaximicrobium wynnwilliamsii]